jgi:twin BRCT domain
MESLLKRIKGLQSYDATAFSEIIVTGSGFSGSSRANLRLMCSKTGIKYCGDLISGWSTHLVVNDFTFNAASLSTNKMRAAAKWGVPILRLQWLLDSIQQGEPLCENPYLLKIRSKDSTLVAKAEQEVVTAARPTAMLSSKQGSNSAPIRTPLRSVENVAEQLEKLVVTPKASVTSKVIAQAELQAVRGKLEKLSPNPAATTISLLVNSSGETPTATPCRSEVPFEMAVVIDCPRTSPSVMPATELKTDDEAEEGEEESVPDSSVDEEKEEEEKTFVVASLAEALPSPSPVSPAAVPVPEAEPQKSPKWWDSQDDLWVPGSQPRDTETPLPPESTEESQEKSFSFDFVAPPNRRELSLSPPLSGSLVPEENTLDTSSRSSNSMTPMSETTPLDIPRPDMTKIYIAESPTSTNNSDDGGSEPIENLNMPSCSPALEIQQGGQLEWWEDDEDTKEEDCSNIDVIRKKKVKNQVLSL